MIDLFRIDSEITNKCNSACPACPRTGPDGKDSDVVKAQGLVDLDLKHIDNILLSQAGFSVNTWTYCGNYGDPFMHEHAFDFVYKVAEYGVKYQRFDTNGGMRSPKFWSDLGRIPGITVNFALDGLEDTNHLYRVKTKWSNIMANAEAFIKAGGKATWTMLIFAHNEHQIDDCRALSQKMGFEEFYVKKSTRRIIVPENQKQSKDVQVKKVDYNFQLSKKMEQKAVIDGAKKQENKTNVEQYGVKQFNITCQAIKKTQLYITPQGMVLPCCHVHTGVYENRFGITSKRNQFDNVLIDNNIKTNLNEFSFDEIVASYRENIHVFEQHWKNRDIPMCNRKCGSNLANKVEKVA